MHFVIQSNLFKEDLHQELLEQLERQGISYSVHETFDGDIVPDIELTGPVICLGAYTIGKVALKKAWCPGVWSIEHQDFQTQVDHWGPHMLNFNSIVCPVQDIDLRVYAGRLYFVRPTKDSKAFSGRVFDSQELLAFRNDVLAGKVQGDCLTPETLVQMAPVQPINAEHRLWIVKNRIVTWSSYKPYVRQLVPPEVIAFAEARMAEWSPHETYVMDVCETQEGLKIVEINTLNACGFYAGNVGLLVHALNEAYSEENQDEPDDCVACRDLAN